MRKRSRSRHALQISRKQMGVARLLRPRLTWQHCHQRRRALHQSLQRGLHIRQLFETMHTLGAPAWADDTDLGSADGRRRAHDSVDAHLGAWTADRQADEVAELLTGAGVPAATVIPGRDVVANPPPSANV